MQRKYTNIEDLHVWFWYYADAYAKTKPKEPITALLWETYFTLDIAGRQGAKRIKYVPIVAFGNEHYIDRCPTSDECLTIQNRCNELT